MANKKINILFFNYGTGTKFTDGIQKLYSSDENFKSAFADYHEDAIDILKSWDSGIILSRVNDKTSLAEILSLLKVSKNAIRDNVFKFASFNEIAKPNIEPVLRKFGTSEIIDANMRPKTLKFKIDFWSKTLKSRNQDEDDDKTTVKGGKDAEQENYNQKSKIIFVPSLELESDCWILNHKNDSKKILRRWLVKMVGPGPAAGHWTEVQNKAQPENSVWKWVQHEKWEDFIMDEGTWFFSGMKPEFDWKEKRWNFSGDVPALFFKNGNTNTFRFQAKGDKLEICENSDFAKSKLERIHESISEEVDIKGDKEKEYDDMQVSSEDGDLGGNLKGDVQGEEDDIERDNSSNFKEDDLGGNYDGKGSTDKFGGELEGDVESVEKEEKESRKSNFKEEAKDGNYDGKGSTDDLGGDLKGAIEGGASESAKKKKSNFKEDEYGGNYDGNGKTDKKNSDPLAGDVEGTDDLGGPYKGELERKEKQDLRSAEDNNEYGGEDEDTPEEVQLREIFGKKKTFFKEGDPEAEMFEDPEFLHNLKRKEQNKADNDAKDDALNQLEKSISKDRTDKTVGLEKKADNKVDLSQFTDKSKDAKEEKEQLIDTKSNRKLNDLSGGDQFKNGARSKKIQIPNAKGISKDLTFNNEDYVETAAGDKVSLESGEIRAVMIKGEGPQEQHIICTFEDLADDHLVIRAPKGSSEHKQIAKVYLSFKYSTNTASLKLNGKVTSVEEDSDGTVLLTIDTGAQEPAMIENFMKLYRQRQENISKFLKQAKGVG
ncbi:MAG: hypothetical protein JNM93_01980 [Bacteriovoracaceae bacterium]|nr:hypothetical protein [Bacteriovoracaceae bacterium]